MGNLNNTTLHSDKFIVPNYLRSSSDQHRVKMSPVLQRLNSVGEDIDQHLTDKYTSITSVRSSIDMSKMMRELSNNSFKTSCGLRRDQSSSWRSRSIPISVTSNTRELYINRGGKLLKSHSLPEVVSSQEGLNQNQIQSVMDFKFNDKPDRSWSIGSCGDEQTLYKQYLYLNLKSAHNFFKNRTLSEPHRHPFHNIPINPQGPRVEEGLDYCCYNKSQENEEQLSLNSFCSSALSSLVEYERSCATFSVCKMDNDHVEMVKDNGSESMDQSPKRPSSSIYVASSKYTPHELENEGEESEFSTDRSSVLFLPRKTCKKGRPSSKKQKKRKREKQKHASKTSRDICSTSDLFNESSDKKDCSDGSNTSEFKSSSSVITSSRPKFKYVNTSLSQNVSTPIKSNSHHPIVQHFFSMVVSSESEDSGSDTEEDCDWSQSEESASACISSSKGKGLSIDLNLDLIYKQKHVPSLESLLSSECSDDSIAASPSNGNCFNISGFSLSEEDVDDSIEFADSSPLSSFVSESLFHMPEAKFHGGTSGYIEDTDSIAEIMDADHEVDMHEVNTKWNEIYSSPDICSCCTKNIATGAGKAVLKVNFFFCP